ncbi:hypothetical protein MRX96_030497 [Rhipicephalus microplus]
MLPLLQHDDAVDCVPSVYPATPLEVDPGTLHGFSDGLPRVPPMTDVIYSKPFIANTWSATSTRDAIKAIAAAPRISGQNSGITGMSLNRCLFFTRWPGRRRRCPHGEAVARALVGRTRRQVRCDVAESVSWHGGR